MPQPGQIESVGQQAHKAEKTAEDIPYYKQLQQQLRDKAVEAKGIWSRTVENGKEAYEINREAFSSDVSLTSVSTRHPPRS